MKCVYLLFFAATFVALGCSGSVTGPSDVSGDTWQLVSLQQGSSDPVTVSDPSRYTLRLTANGRVEVKSDCNACGGSYALSGNSFDVSPTGVHPGLLRNGVARRGIRRGTGRRTIARPDR